MNEKLPMWLQALGIVCLSCALMGTAVWVWRNEARIVRGNLEGLTRNVMLFMSFAVVLLAARFLWRFKDRRSGKNVLDRALFWMGVLFTLPALILLIRWCMPPIQRVRESGQSFTASTSFPWFVGATPSRPMELEQIAHILRSRRRE